MRKALRRWLWLCVTAIVLLLVVYLLARNPEWRRFSWHRFWTTLERAHPALLLAGVGASLLTFLVRAYRWKLFLDPIKKGSLGVLFVGQIFGFTSIYLIGRAGELVRPAYIAREEKVSFTSQLAVLLLERIYDAIFLILVYATAVAFLPVVPTTHRGKLVLEWMRWGGAAMFVFSVLTVLGVVAYRRNTDRLAGLILRTFRFLPLSAQNQLERFLRSFSEGLGVIRGWKDLVETCAVTVFLWFVSISVFWTTFQSLDGDLGRLPWQAACLALFCAGLGLTLQFPGIGGGYQVGALLALTGIFGVRREEAVGAAFLVWFLISVPCIALGVILLARKGLSLVKLRALAEEERKTDDEMSVLRSRGR